MKPSDPVSIVTFVLAALSVLGTTWTSYTLYKPAQHTTYARLLYYLNVTATLESIFSLPFIFSMRSRMCHIVGWVHTFFAFSNMVATTLLTLYHMNNVYSTDFSLSRVIRRWCAWFVFVCPLISLLGFIGDGYEQDNVYWCGCVIETTEALAWGIAVYYFWIWSALLLNIFVIFKVFLAARKLELSSRSTLFSTVGLIALVAVAIWIPRTVRRFYSLANYSWSEENYALLTLPIFISGIFYTVMLWYDQSAMELEDLQLDSSTQSLAAFDFDWGEILPSFSMSMANSQAVRDSLRTFENPLPNGSIALNPIIRSTVQQQK